jgi:hypothetical protein
VGSWPGSAELRGVEELGGALRACVTSLLIWDRGALRYKLILLIISCDHAFAMSRA